MNSTVYFTTASGDSHQILLTALPSLSPDSDSTKVEDSVNKTEISDAPKTFSALLKKASEANIGFCEFFRAFLTFVSSIIGTIVVLCFHAIPMFMIFFGTVHLHNCPLQKSIPIGLIVGGCVAMLSTAINFRERYKQFSESGIAEATVTAVFKVFFHLFLAVWLMLMCYWVYTTKFDIYARFGPRYCHALLYLSTFWFLGTILIISGTIVIFTLVKASITVG